MSIKQVKSCFFYAALHLFVSCALIFILYFTWLGSNVGMTSSFSVSVLTWILRIMTFPLNIIILIIGSQVEETLVYIFLLPLSSMLWGILCYNLKRMKHKHTDCFLPV